ncbi:MAG: hypothetical protein AMXMBFR84_46630 [Candidatus Hydrogenedentota bacterium]
MEQKTCAFCNEHIEEILVHFGDVRILDEEYWHLECYAEYFGEALEEV